MGRRLLCVAVTPHVDITGVSSLDNIMKCLHLEMPQRKELA